MSDEYLKGDLVPVEHLPHTEGREFEPFTTHAFEGGALLVVTNPNTQGQSPEELHNQLFDNLNQTLREVYGINNDKDINSSNKNAIDICHALINRTTGDNKQPFRTEDFLFLLEEHPSLTTHIEPLLGTKNGPVAIVLGYGVDTSRKGSRLTTADLPFHHSQYSKSRVIALVRHGQNREILSLVETRLNNISQIDSIDSQWVNFIFSGTLHQLLNGDQHTDYTLAQNIMDASGDYYQQVSQLHKSSQEQHLPRRVKLNHGSNTEDLRLAIRALLHFGYRGNDNADFLPTPTQLDARQIISNLINQNKLAYPLWSISTLAANGSRTDVNTIENQLSHAETELEVLQRETIINWSHVFSLLPPQVKPLVQANLILVANGLANLASQEITSQADTVKQRLTAEGGAISIRTETEQDRIAAFTQAIQKEATAERQALDIEQQTFNNLQQGKIDEAQLIQDLQLELLNTKAEEIISGMSQLTAETRNQTRIYFEDWCSWLIQNGYQELATKFGGYGQKLLAHENANQEDGNLTYVEMPDFTDEELAVAREIDIQVLTQDNNWTTLSALEE